MDDSAADFNAFMAYAYAIGRDTPARQWFYARHSHPAIYRALCVDPTDHCAVYACAPFRLHQDETGARILCALPCPRLLSYDDYLDVETVIAWNPRTNTAKVWGDEGLSNVVGTIAPTAQEGHIFTDPFAFFRALVEARAQWFDAARFALHDEWRTIHEIDHTPGLLVMGEVGKANLRVQTLPRDLVCHGIDPQALNRVLLRQARVPRARNANALQAAA